MAEGGVGRRARPIRHCDQAGCKAARAADADLCLTHCSPPQRETALTQASSVGHLDVRGTQINRALLEEMLCQLTQDRRIAAAIDFSGAVFTDRAVLSAVTFEQPVSFSGSKFCKDALFQDSMFTDVVTFESAEFHGHTRFSRATFLGPAIFRRTLFVGLAGFGGASFEGKATFAHCHARNQLRFKAASFKTTSLLGPVAALHVNLERSAFTQKVLVTAYSDNLTTAGASSNVAWTSVCMVAWPTSRRLCSRAVLRAHGRQQGPLPGRQMGRQLGGRAPRRSRRTSGSCVSDPNHRK